MKEEEEAKAVAAASLSSSPPPASPAVEAITDEIHCVHYSVDASKAKGAWLWGVKDPLVAVKERHPKAMVEERSTKKNGIKVDQYHCLFSSKADLLEAMAVTKPGEAARARLCVKEDFGCLSCGVKSVAHEAFYEFVLGAWKKEEGLDWKTAILLAFSSCVPRPLIDNVKAEGKGKGHWRVWVRGHSERDAELIKAKGTIKAHGAMATPRWPFRPTPCMHCGKPGHASATCVTVKGNVLRFAFKASLVPRSVGVVRACLPSEANVVGVWLGTTMRWQQPSHLLHIACSDEAGREAAVAAVYARYVGELVRGAAEVRALALFDHCKLCGAHEHKESVCDMPLRTTTPEKEIDILKRATDGAEDEATDPEATKETLKTEDAVRREWKEQICMQRRWCKQEVVHLHCKFGKKCRFTHPTAAQLRIELNTTASQQRLRSLRGAEQEEEEEVVVVPAATIELPEPVSVEPTVIRRPSLDGSAVKPLPEQAASGSGAGQEHKEEGKEEKKEEQKAEEKG